MRCMESSKITETRYLQITGKIFSKKDLKNIAEILEKELTDVSKEQNASLEISVICDDSTSYSTGNSTIFDQKFVDQKRIKKVLMQYWNLVQGDRVKLEVTHANAGSLMVEGKDSNWVNGILGRISDVLSACQPQLKIINKRSFVIFLFLIEAIAITFLLLEISLFLVPYIASLFMSSEAIERLMGMPASAVFVSLTPASFMIASALTNSIINLWPIVEIQTGPLHKNMEVKRRYFLWGLFTLIILPFLINQFS